MWTATVAKRWEATEIITQAEIGFDNADADSSGIAI